MPSNLVNVNDGWKLYEVRDSKINELIEWLEANGLCINLCFGESVDKYNPKVESDPSKLHHYGSEK